MNGIATKLSAGATPALLLTQLLAAKAPVSAAATGLRIDVRLSGADLAGAQAFRTTLERASIELHAPASEPGSVITVAQVTVRSMIEVASPELRAAGIRLTVVARG